jgi:hypothetical protein
MVFKDKIRPQRYRNILSLSRWEINEKGSISQHYKLEDKVGCQRTRHQQKEKKIVFIMVIWKRMKDEE